MKLKALALGLIVLATPPVLNPKLPTDIQEPSTKALSDIQKLEAQFKQIDEEADEVKVDVSGDSESSGTITIKVESREYPSSVSTATANKENVPQPLIRIKKLLEIDLSKVDIPDEYIKQKITAILLSRSTKGSLPGVKVMQIDATQDYEVVEDYTYNSGIYRMTVWKGFRYDRASIPKIFWVLIDKDSLSNVAPLFHDFLYRHGGVVRTENIIRRLNTCT